MATNTEHKFLGLDGTEQLVATVKNVLGELREGLSITVKLTEQTLTDEQKAQVRENIGAPQVQIITWEDND